MKRLLVILFLLLAANARAAVIFPINDLSGYIGNFPTNYNQTISNLNAAISAGGGDLSALSNGVINVGLAATNAGLGVTQVGLAATNAGLGVTQVGLAATNAAIDAALAITNFTGTGLTGSKVGRNLFLTNAASGGGGAYSFTGTNNIAPTNGLNPVAVNAHETVIGGGVSNAMVDGVFFAVIGGGSSNVIQASSGFPNGATIGGGTENTIIDANSGTISGGKKNKITSTGLGNLIAGGGWNEIITIGGGYNAILGGGDLSYPSKILGAGTYNVLVNGYNNHITNASNWCLIGDGDDNNIGAANFAAILNGESDTILDADYSTIINGQSHTIGSAATYSTIVNGKQNAIAPSAAYALAGGRRAKANHPGVFIWADSTDADFASTADKQFLIRAAGGTFITLTNTVAAPVAGATLTVEGDLYVTGGGHFGSNSVWVGQTHLGEVQLKSLYTSQMVTWMLGGLSVLLIVNFGRDRKRERADKRRDAAQSKRILELEKKLGIVKEST